MSSHRTSFCLLTLMAALAPGVMAQTARPGLWESTHKMGGNPKMDAAMAQMEKQMAAMPADQRKMMQDMMAKQGVAIGGAAAGGGTVVKVCISKEMAERQQMPTQTQGECTTTISDKTASSMKMRFVCKNPPSTGEGVYTFAGDTAYTMKMNFSSTVKGKPETMTMEGSGKWLAADCGGLKPMPVHP